MSTFATDSGIGADERRTGHTSEGLRHKPRHKDRLGYLDLRRKLLIKLVGAARFELTTPCAQGRCATRLRYAPTFSGLFILNHFPNLRYRPVCQYRAKSLRP